MKFYIVIFFFNFLVFNCFILAMQNNMQLLASYIDNLNNYSNKLSHEEIFFYSKEAESSNKLIKRYADFYTYGENAILNVVICHGFLSDRHIFKYFHTLFPNCNCIIFDFRAHGDATEGQESTIGKHEAFDVLSAAEFIKNKFPRIPTIVYGVSMGAAAAIEAQAREAVFDLMILDSAYDSSSLALDRGLETILKIKIGNKIYKIPGKQFILNNIYNDTARPIIKLFFKMITNLDPNKVNTKFVKVEPSESVKNIKVPIFYIRCKNDDKVSIEAAQNIYKNAGSEIKVAWETNGKSHCMSYLEQPLKYKYFVLKFIYDYFSGNVIKSEFIVDPEKMRPQSFVEVEVV